MLIISHRSDACDVTPATDAEKGQKPAYQCKEGGCCLPRGGAMRLCLSRVMRGHHTAFFGIEGEAVDTSL